MSEVAREAARRDELAQLARAAQAREEEQGRARLAQHGEIQREVEPRLTALEQVLGYPVVTYFMADGVVMEDSHSLHMFEHLRRLGQQDQLGLFISSRGGQTETPWKLVSLLREYADRWTAIIPYRAHSSATLLALGADEILMTPMAELGPTDPSRQHALLPRADQKPIGPVSVQELRHVLSFLEREIGKDKMTPEVAGAVYTKLFEHVHPLAIGALEQSWALARHVCRQVLATHMDTSTEEGIAAVDAIVERFSDGYKSHGYPISRREAHDSGLNVRSASPDEVAAIWDLYRLYDQELKLAGEGEVNGQRASVSIAGHINSSKGTTLGLNLVTDRGEALTEWGSSWWTQPV